MEERIKDRRKKDVNEVTTLEKHFNVYTFQKTLIGVSHSNSVFSLISSFQPQSANSISTTKINKKIKETHNFLLSSHFSLLPTFIWDKFCLRICSIIPHFGAAHAKLFAISIFPIIYINRSDKLGSRRKKFKLAGGIGSLNMGCRK